MQRSRFEDNRDACLARDPNDGTAEHRGVVTTGASSPQHRQDVLQHRLHRWAGGSVWTGPWCTSAPRGARHQQRHTLSSATPSAAERTSSASALISSARPKNTRCRSMFEWAQPRERGTVVRPARAPRWHRSGQGWGPHTISGCPMDGRPRGSLLRLIGKSGTSPAGLIMLFPSDVGRRQLRWFDG